MRGFGITINDDGTVRWHGVETGKTRVLAINRERKMIVLHTAGHMYTSGQTQEYGPAKINVHEYEDKHDSEYDNYIILKELFGVMEWGPRDKWTTQTGENK